MHDKKKPVRKCIHAYGVGVLASKDGLYAQLDAMNALVKPIAVGAYKKKLAKSVMKITPWPSASITTIFGR